MVKFDVALLRYLEKEDFRVLIAVEMGMKNHELVPESLVSSISSLRGGGVGKILQNLCRHKLLAYERGKRYDGYRLTYLGYDYIALNALRCAGSLSQVGNQIGVGKESDVYVATGDEGQRYALKLHRLGRTCFRNVNNKRDYHTHGKKLSSWIYASRLAATREAAFMQILHSESFPVPELVASNRHVVVMQMLEGTLLNSVGPDDVPDPDKLYDRLMGMILTLANRFGLVHGDFNEFNIMLMDGSDSDVRLIDFPQMVPVNHKFARSYFERDVTCISSFFNKRFGMEVGELPVFETDVHLDGGANERIKLPDLPEFPHQFLDQEKDQDIDLNASDSLNNELEQFSITDHPDSRVTEDPVPAVEEEDRQTVSESDVLCCQLDSVSVFSAASKSTIAPHEVKNRLKKQKSKAAKREAVKTASKSVKGEACAVSRKRKDLLLNIREDLVTHAMGQIC